MALMIQGSEIESKSLWPKIWMNLKMGLAYKIIVLHGSTNRCKRKACSVTQQCVGKQSNLVNDIRGYLLV